MKMTDSTNINVVVRCRTRNQKEIQAKSPVIVDIPTTTTNKTPTELHINTTKDIGVMAKMNSKTYTVDQVYGSATDQRAIFKGVAEPLFKDFLDGYNCTIFAYGQTGSGKTYTMCGDDKDVNGSFAPHAGIIPRVLYKLFESLEATDDFVIKCSFVELYNEELRDLLSEDNHNKKLRIFESKNESFGNSNSSSNSNILNKNTIHIQNLEEAVIKDAHHGLKILQKGLKLRKVASTKLNDYSSRSHTIFTLNLYKNSEQNEEFRFSKMNLVDLAGSENINRSGAVNQRAREAGSINQSLLTLGRVINCLASDSTEKEKDKLHIPYRESKLTRLLQDSLGGKTKTVLIAAISPARANIEETSSTLEYASKAKNIRNQPQIGNLISKNLLIKDIALELAKLKSDLSSTRAKNGVYLEKSNYDDLIDNNENYKSEILENQRKNELARQQLESLNGDLANEKSKSLKLKEDLKCSEQETMKLKESIKKQKLKEETILKESKTQKELIQSLQNSLIQLEKQQESFVSTFHSQLQSVLSLEISKINNILLGNVADTSIDKESAEIKREIGKIVDSLQTTVFTKCELFALKLNDRYPTIVKDFERYANDMKGLEKHTSEIGLSVERAKSNDENWSTTIEERIKFESLLKESAEKQKAAMQKQQNELLINIQKLISNSYNSNDTLIESNFDNLSELLGQERQKLLDSKQVWGSNATFFKDDIRNSVESIKNISGMIREQVIQKVKDFSKQIDSNNQTIKTELEEIKSTCNITEDDKGGLFRNIHSIEKKFVNLLEQNGKVNIQLSDINDNLTKFKNKNNDRIITSPQKDMRISRIQTQQNPNLSPTKRVSRSNSPRKGEFFDGSDKENHTQKRKFDNKVESRIEAKDMKKRQTLSVAATHKINRSRSNIPTRIS